MKVRFLTAMLLALATQTAAQAVIISVNETGLGGDTPAIIVNGGFAEDALTFSDRTHQHNGVRVNNGSGLLTTSTSGSTAIPLPDYLLGGDYVRFANNARDNNPYSAEVTVDVLADWYLLIDNRVNGPAGNNSSPNTTDPVLGGTLQWVLDAGWQRVNTGYMPNSQADYTGVDESGDGVGPGQGLNQFYSVYTLKGLKSVTVSSNGIGGNNMISLVAVAVPEPATASLALLGLGGLAMRRRRRAC